MQRHSPFGFLEALIFPAWLRMGVLPLLPLAVMGSGVVSALGNYFGGKSAAKAQKYAADQNLTAQRETNAQNLEIFHDSRGAGGSALLPEYLKYAEAELGGGAVDVARALFGYGGGPAQRIADAEGTLARYNPALEAGDNLVYDLSTGKVGNDRTAALAPVKAARTGLAKGRAAAINQSLDETLAGLRAAGAARGFRGGSTFETNRALAATSGARTAAAGELGQANLDNALADQALSDSNLQMLLQSLDLPFARGQQRLAFNNLPMASVADSYSSAMTPLNFFRMGGGNPPYASAPQMPVIPNTGQLAGAAVAGLGQNLGQYFAQQQMMQELSNYFRPQASYLGNGSWMGPGGMPAGGGGFPSGVTSQFAGFF